MGHSTHYPYPKNRSFQNCVIRHTDDACNTVLTINNGGFYLPSPPSSHIFTRPYVFFFYRLEAFQKLCGVLPGLRVAARRWNSSKCTFDPKHLKILACPLSKKPLKFDESQQKLVNEELNIAYNIIDGIPCLIPEEGQLLS